MVKKEGKRAEVKPRADAEGREKSKREIKGDYLPMRGSKSETMPGRKKVGEEVPAQRLDSTAKDQEFLASLSPRGWEGEAQDDPGDSYTNPGSYATEKTHAEMRLAHRNEFQKLGKEKSKLDMK